MNNSVEDELRLEIKDHEDYGGFLTRENNKLKEENTKLKEQLTWQDIETAPKDGTQILIKCKFSGNYTFVTAYWGEHFNGFNWRGLETNYHKDVATHWMPIPEFSDNK